jgi:hypothetical protein
MVEYGAAAEVVLRAEHQPYPYRDSRWVRYCIGSFATHLCGPELLTALRNGDVESIVSATTYTMHPLAADYARYWWEARQRHKRSGDEIFAQLAKVMVNSFAGKWAQQTSKWALDANVPAPRPWYRWPGRTIGDKGIDHYQALAGVTYRAVRRDPADKSFPAIAAYITSLGRARMDALRAAAGERNILYQCVDSLHCTPAGVVGLERAGEIHDGHLGLLRETAEYQCVDYIGCNLYKADGQWKAAGLGSLHCQLEDGSLDVTTFERLQSMLARNPDGSVYVTHRPWRPEVRYCHSVPGRDGWCSPVRLP